MLIILIFLLIQMFDSNIYRINIFGVESIYICIALLFIYYLYTLLFKKNKIIFCKENIAILCFTIIGFIKVLLSYLNIRPFIANTEIEIDNSYIARQAFYYAFFPLFFIFPNNSIYRRIEDFVTRNKYMLFILLFIYSIITNLDNISMFVICYLLLCNNNNKKVDYILLISLFVLLIINGGLTQLLLFILLVVIKFADKRINISRILSYGLIICLLLCFLTPFVSEKILSVLDYNTKWRLLYWKDEITQLLNTYGFGVGYGTAYATKGFVETTAYIEEGAFSATDLYTVEQQMFLTASHNSFISIAFRLGIIGFLIFSYFIVNLSKEISKYNELIDSKTKFVFYAAVVVIACNVGLESPSYLLLFCFSICYLLFKLKGIKDKKDVIKE